MTAQAVALRDRGWSRRIRDFSRFGFLADLFVIFLGSHLAHTVGPIATI